MWLKHALKVAMARVAVMTMVSGHDARVAVENSVAAQVRNNLQHTLNIEVAVVGRFGESVGAFDHQQI